MLTRYARRAPRMLRPSPVWREKHQDQVLLLLLLCCLVFCTFLFYLWPCVTVFLFCGSLVGLVWYWFALHFTKTISFPLLHAFSTHALPHTPHCPTSPSPYLPACVCHHAHFATTTCHTCLPPFLPACQIDSHSTIVLLLIGWVDCWLVGCVYTFDFDWLGWTLILVTLPATAPLPRYPTHHLPTCAAPHTLPHYCYPTSPLLTDLCVCICVCDIVDDDIVDIVMCV